MADGIKSVVILEMLLFLLAEITIEVSSVSIADGRSSFCKAIWSS
jgi:hypothetical protein